MLVEDIENMSLDLKLLDVDTESDEVLKDLWKSHCYQHLKILLQAAPFSTIKLKELYQQIVSPDVFAPVEGNYQQHLRKKKCHFISFVQKPPHMHPEKYNSLLQVFV